MRRFLIDENLSPSLAAHLQREGYDAQAVRDAGLKGAEDEVIVRWLQTRQVTLITSDLDFGEFFYSKGLGSFGVIILGSKTQRSASYIKILRSLQSEGVLDAKDIHTSLVAATERGYRIRRFKD